MIVVSWSKPRGYELCHFTYFIDAVLYETETDEESYSIAWQNEEIFVEVSINQFGGRSFPKGITIRAPFPPVTNIKHNNMKEGWTNISWSKPDTQMKIEHYVVIWDNTVETVRETTLSATFTKCTDLEIVVYVQYKSQVSANVTYNFNILVGEECFILTSILSHSLLKLFSCGLLNPKPLTP